MAGTTLGFLKFVLGFDTIAFKKGMSEADRELLKLSNTFKKFGKGMADVGKTMSVAISAPLVAFAALGVKEARETKEAMAQVEAGLASMGAVSGKTAVELEKLADKMELHSLYEADEILRKVTTNLLTFGNISGEMFNRTQQVVVELATKMQTDLQSAALLVGKAMNDPIKGMAGLGRAGIQFSVAQKEVIKNLVLTGQTAKAQTIIMAELERQFGGSAQAAQNADPYNALTDALKNLAEQLGNAVLPYLKTAADFATNLATKFDALDDSTKAWVVTIGLIVAGLGPLLYLLGNLITIAAGVKTLTLFAAGLSAIAVSEGAAATGAYALGAALAPLLGPVALATAAAWALYEAFNAFPTLKNAVTSTIGAIADWIGGPLLDALYKAFPILKAVVAVMSRLGGAAGGKTLADITGDIAGSASRIGAEFAASGRGAKPLIPAFLGGGGGGKKSKAAKKTVDAAKQLADRVSAINDRLFPDEAAERQYQKDLADLTALYGKTADGADKLTAALKALNAEREKRITADLTDVPILPDVPSPIDEFDIGASNDKIERETDKTLKTVAELNRNKTQEMAEAWGSFAQSAVDSMRYMVDAFKSGDILGGIQAILDIVLNLVQTLASVGMIGGGGAGGGGGGAGGGGLSAGARQGFGGFRARGGPIVPGKVYGVGENGPEWFSSKKRGFIHPTGKESQGQRLVVVPSPYFDVVVDNRAANVAAPMAGQAAVIGVTGSEVRASRRARRNLLAA